MRRIEREEVRCVEQKPFRGVKSLHPHRRRASTCPIHRVNHCQESNLLSTRLELLSDLVCYSTAHAVSAEEIRPVRLDPTDLLNIKCSHFLDACQRCTTAVQAPALQAIEWLISSQMPREVSIKQNVSTVWMNTEK